MTVSVGNTSSNHRFSGDMLVFGGVRCLKVTWLALLLPNFSARSYGAGLSSTGCHEIWHQPKQCTIICKIHQYICCLSDPAPKQIGQYVHIMIPVENLLVFLKQMFPFATRAVSWSTTSWRTRSLSTMRRQAACGLMKHDGTQSPLPSCPRLLRVPLPEIADLINKGSLTIGSLNQA